MKGLKAALWKDLRLFRSGVGLLTLLLPLLLLFALRLTGGASRTGVYLDPFPIAVRDRDGTVMSRSLTGQIAGVELFSQVIRAEAETDEALFSHGCAGVLTIPKDFFYDAYSMESAPIEIVLNEDMPLQASLLHSMVRSVLDLMSSDQAACRALYRFRYGTLTKELERQLWEESAQRLVMDALGRRRIFDSAVQASNAQALLENSFLSCALSMLCLFFALSSVWTLPEELDSGILPRFLAAGGRWSAFFLSKLLTGAMAALPSLLLLLGFFSPERPGPVLLLTLLLYLSAFGLALALAVWAGQQDALRRWSSLFLLLSLLFGGSLYPPERLPPAARVFSRLTLPYHAQRGLDAITAHTGIPRLLLSQWPVLLLGLAGLLIALTGFRRKRRRGRPPLQGQPGLSEPFSSPACSRRLPRLLSVALHRALAMSGGGRGVACLLCCMALCGALAGAALEQDAPAALELAAVDSGGPLASELLDRLAAQNGVRLRRVTAGEGQSLLAQGAVEGLLLLGSDYDAALRAGTDPTLSYRSAPSSVSSQAAQEIIAGQFAAQRAQVRALLEAQAYLGRPLTPEEERSLTLSIQTEQTQAPPLYRTVSRSGPPASSDALLQPSVLGFAALAVMLTLFPWAAWTGRPDVRRVERRMFSLPGGKALSYGGDALALLTLGLAAGLAVLLPSGLPTPAALAALAAYSFCVTGLALALTRLTALNSRMDLLSPFLALISCLAGGCFGAAPSLSPALRTLSLLTPQGLALLAQRGTLWPFIPLLAGGALLLWAGAPRKINV